MESKENIGGISDKEKVQQLFTDPNWREKVARQSGKLYEEVTVADAEALCTENPDLLLFSREEKSDELPAEKPAPVKMSEFEGDKRRAA